MESPEQATAPAGRRPSGRAAVHGFGELLITAGVVLLLFVLYEVHVTDWFSGRKQAEATQRLRERWAGPHPERSAPVAGQGFARLYIPAFGPDHRFTVLEGVDRETLSTGPGHYPGTALPGEPGNFAVAGHRIGRGAPFNELDELESCDAIVVETASEWYVYRVLPMREEVAGWDGRNGDPRCAGIVPGAGSYEGVVGRRIVDPGRSEVILPVPGRPGAELPPRQRAELITLTTCHPEFSAEQRLIIHGVLTERYPKDSQRPGLRPPELVAGRNTP